VEEETEIEMSAASELIQHASTLRTMLLKADDSEILAHADELLYFLNRIKDLSMHNKKQIPALSIDDIIYGLESNPEITLQDKSIRTRLLNLFMELKLRCM